MRKIVVKIPGKDVDGLQTGFLLYFTNMVQVDLIAFVVKILLLSHGKTSQQRCVRYNANNQSQQCC